MAIQLEAASDRVARGLRSRRRARPEFVCATCGYGVALDGSLPECPMCRATTWEPAPWRPFTSLASPGRPGRNLDGFGADLEL